MKIATTRLIIRDYTPADWQDLLEIFSDPEVMKYCEPVYDAAGTRNALELFIKKSIAYAVTLANTGKVIGHVLFAQLPDAAEGIYEIGWFFNRAYWRRGYAFEAAQALIQYGFEQLKLHKITAETIDPVHSGALAQKLGMAWEGTFCSHIKAPNGRWADLYWYGILNPQEE